MGFFSRMSVAGEEPGFERWLESRGDKTLNELPYDVQVFAYALFSGQVKVREAEAEAMEKEFGKRMATSPISEGEGEGEG